jgi:hypothetical protein
MKNIAQAKILNKNSKNFVRRLFVFYLGGWRKVSRWGDNEVNNFILAKLRLPVGSRNGELP